MQVVFSNRAFTALLAETLCKIQTETGGVFLGKYQDETWYIVESIDPGPNSIFQIDYFEYDQPYIQHLINKKRLLYSEQLDLLGLWHRHPGTFDRFSRTDDGTNAIFAARKDYGAISFLVNLEPEFRITLYHVAQPCRYSRIEKYKVGDEYIPEKLLSYKDKSILLSKLNGKSCEAKDKTERTLNVLPLSDVMNIVLPRLRQNYCYENRLDILGMLNKEDFSEKIANSIAGDVLYLSERFHIPFYPIVELNKIILQQQNECDEELIFCYAVREKAILLKYRKETFFYKTELLKSIIEEEYGRDGI